MVVVDKLRGETSSILVLRSKSLRGALQRLLTLVVAFVCCVGVAYAVECIWETFDEFKKDVNKAAFKRAKELYEKENPGKTFNNSLIDSNGDGTADPLQNRYYTLERGNQRGYACSEFSAYVHNLLQKEFGLQKGDVQTVWNHNHSIIRLRDGLICDGKKLSDGYRYVEPQGMRDEGNGYGFGNKVTAFDDPNPIRPGIWDKNPNAFGEDKFWGYDGPGTSTGYVTDGPGGGLFGGGGLANMGAPLLGALIASMMNQNGNVPPLDPNSLEGQLFNSLQPSPTPVVPTPTALPTQTPNISATSTPQPSLTQQPTPSPEATTTGAPSAMGTPSLRIAVGAPSTSLLPGNTF